MYLSIINQSEILLVNLVIAYFLSTRKFSVKITFISLVLYSLLSVVPYFIIDSDLPQYIPLLVGFTFIIPLTILFKESILKMSTIMLFTWTHTTFIFKLSILSAYFINDDLKYLPAIILGITLLISFPLIATFSRRVYKIIVDGITDESFKLLMLLTILLFTMTMMLFFFAGNSVNAILAVFLLEITSVTVYILLQRFVIKSNRVIALNKIAFTDSLTKLENRFSLFAKTNELIESNTQFHCVYMDLDELKSINDTFGHDTGDRYLQAFSSAVTKSISKNSVFYRIAGDEFVLISKNDEVDIIKLKADIETHFEFEFDFKGVSIGYSTYLKDGTTIDDLLKAADQKMYRRKQINKFRVQKR